jgi:hypothetical protein
MAAGRLWMWSLPDIRGGHIKIDGAAYQRFIASGGGPYMKELEYVSSAVQQGARAMIRPSQVRTSGQLSLRDSIVKRIFVSGRVPFARVIGNKPYAFFLHEGTQPHEIRPRNAQTLRFYSQRVGGFVFARVVQHPGTRPLRYLTGPAQQVMSRLRRTG